MKSKSPLSPMSFCTTWGKITMLMPNDVFLPIKGLQCNTCGKVTLIMLSDVLQLKRTMFLWNPCGGKIILIILNDVFVCQKSNVLL